MTERRRRQPRAVLREAEAPLIGALLRLASRSVLDRVVRDLNQNGFEDIRAAHVAVFEFARGAGIRPSELAQRLRTTKQAMNYLTQHLEDRGYLRREPDPGDSRARHLKLTRRGERLVARMRRTVREIEREWAEKLGPSNFEQLRRWLALLVLETPDEHWELWQERDLRPP